MPNEALSVAASNVLNTDTVGSSVNVARVVPAGKPVPPEASQACFTTTVYVLLDTPKTLVE